MTKNKFYTVWIGHKPGIYDNWNECKAVIMNYKGACYKGFPDRESAEKLLMKVMKSILTDITR